MKLGQVHLIYAAYRLSSLRFFGSDNQSFKVILLKNLWRHYNFWLPILSKLSGWKICLSFPSFWQRIYNNFNISWKQWDTSETELQLTFIGFDLGALLTVHQRKKYIVLKISTFPDIRDSFFFFFCLVLFLLFLLCLFLLCLWDCTQPWNITKFLKTSYKGCSLLLLAK